MINSIQNKVAYVTLNKEGTINGRIKVEDKQALKKYAVGDVVKVKIESNVVEDNKLKISLSLVPAKE
jgi:ribosomal protein L21E